MSEAEAFESGLESQLLRRQRSGGLGIKLVRSMSSDGADGVLCTCDPPGSQEDCGPGWPSKKLKTLITKAKRVGDMTHVAEHLSSRGELSVQTPVPSQKKKKKRPWTALRWHMDLSAEISTSPHTRTWCCLPCFVVQGPPHSPW
jgi:hypothetical protein